MKVALLYSGVGGANGADYMADMLVAGFRELGTELVIVGKHGGYDLLEGIKAIPGGCAFAIHQSGFNLTPHAVCQIRAKCPLFVWTQNDEIGWWRELICTWGGLVDCHFSYQKRIQYGGPRVGPAEYMPIAAEPSWYYPTTAEYRDSERPIDVCLVGSNRRWRVEFCEGLAKHFKCHFNWSMCLPTNAVNALYNASKIVVAPIQDCDEDVPGAAYGCPCRTFDVRAARSYQLETKRDGLVDAYPLADSVTTSLDVNAAIEQWCDVIASRLADHKRRAGQAEADYQWTLAHHTYRHRAEQMIAFRLNMGKGE